MRGYSFWTCLTAVALAAGAQAQTYTIKLKHGPDVGKSVTVTDSDSKDVTTKLTDDKGNALGKEMTQKDKDEEVYTETVLEKGDKVARKYKRTYEKATRTAGGKTAARSYEGRTLLFEEKDGKYAVTAEGDKPISKEDLEELTKKANDRDDAQEEVFLPKKPIQVGDSWKVDTRELVKAFAKNGKLDEKHTSAEGKLTKVYKKGGHQFGVIVMTLKMAPGEAPPGVKFDTPLVVEMTITLDAAIDGSTTEGQMTMTGKSASKGSVEQMGMKIIFDSKVDLSGKKEQSAEK